MYNVIYMKKASEIFEGKNSSLKKTFDEAIDFDLPEVDDGKKPAKPRVHIGGSVCESCEG